MRGSQKPRSEFSHCHITRQTCPPFRSRQADLLHPAQRATKNPSITCPTINLLMITMRWIPKTGRAHQTMPQIPVMFRWKIPHQTKTTTVAGARRNHRPPSDYSAGKLHCLKGPKRAAKDAKDARRFSHGCHHHRRSDQNFKSTRGLMYATYACVERHILCGHLSLPSASAAGSGRPLGFTSAMTPRS